MNTRGQQQNGKGCISESDLWKVAKKERWIFVERGTLAFKQFSSVLWSFVERPLGAFLDGFEACGIK